MSLNVMGMAGLSASLSAFVSQGAKTGEAKMTKGYNLPAKHVIHTVGPIYSKSNAADSQAKLESAYRNSLTEASKADLKSIVSTS